MSRLPESTSRRVLRSAGPLLLLLALLSARGAAAQIVNAQALFDDETGDGLSGGVEVSADWRTGSNNLLVTRGLVLGQLRQGKHTLLGVARGEYGLAQEETIASRLMEHVRYRYRFVPWLAGETFAQHEFDAFRRLQLRALVGAGPRFTLWKGEAGGLILGVAAMVEYERLRSDDAPDAGNRFFDLRLSSYVLGRVKLMENVSLMETFYVQPKVTRPSDVRLLNETLLAFDVNKLLTLTTGFIVTYDATPPATVSHFDTQLRTALGVKF
ncbi:MAG TPA: DUF481 domain-containing protein [Myxococcaceae bacterium]|nr:DUF481 domain-containing protein [Myxococcaceae bacterium]